MSKNKRLTVLRLLKNTLADKKRSFNASVEYQEMTDVLGGHCDDNKEEQYRSILKRDIDQLEFLIECHKVKYPTE